MRLVDCYIPAILFTRQAAQDLDNNVPDVEALRTRYQQFHEELTDSAEENGFSRDSIMEGWLAFCAYADEILLVTQWHGRGDWQRQPLQRLYFNTTNAGDEFYNRLNQLNKHGEDRSVREVYLLCLGLGFKGRYFDPQDRPQLESARGFNLSLLLPEEAQHNLDQSMLFRTAYSNEQRAAHDRKRRMSLIPFVVALPTLFILGVFLFYASQIQSRLENLITLVG